MSDWEKSGQAVYKRVLLKLSGETLQNAQEGDSLDAVRLADLAQQIKNVKAMNVELAVVVGGGNIFRGFAGQDDGIDRNIGDYMGMLATMINSLALKAVLEKNGIAACVMSALEMPKVADLATSQKVINKLEAGYVTILGGGTGNPYCTTDSAAALRACEIGADVLLKGTKVDGIYSADPMLEPEAERYDQITYTQALERNLKIMDASAFAMCMENDIPIVVFNYFKDNELIRVLSGESAGTLVKS